MVSSCHRAGQHFLMKYTPMSRFCYELCCCDSWASLYVENASRPDEETVKDFMEMCNVLKASWSQVSTVFTSFSDGDYEL